MVFSPTKCFFRSNQHLVSSDQARAIFRTLRQQYGDLIDYKVVRVNKQDQDSMAPCSIFYSFDH
ncbi:hypothetical protein BC940DRAFT_299996 [Gongronella butleri]|nr:hypothetical protein BC940DRAFT_299996 [Gongronella butleri]